MERCALPSGGVMGEGVQGCLRQLRNAVSMNGPGILMPQCRGTGAAVWQAHEERSGRQVHTLSFPQTKEDNGLRYSATSVSIMYERRGKPKNTHASYETWQKENIF